MQLVTCDMQSASCLLFTCSLSLKL